MNPRLRTLNLSALPGKPTALLAMPNLSQKELACAFGITARQLRRLEAAEVNAGHPCSRPYGAGDLVRLYRRRGRRRWSRTDAERLGIGNLMEHVDRAAALIFSDRVEPRPVFAEVMLRALAGRIDRDGDQTGPLSCEMARGLADTARRQLSMIINSTTALDVLAKSFVDAALLAEKTEGVFETNT